MKVFLSIFQCDVNNYNEIARDIKCYTGMFYVYASIGVICSIILIIVMCFLTITFYNNNLFASDQPNTKLTSKQDLHLFICKTTFIIIHIFIVSDKSNLSQWLICIIYLVLSICSFNTYYIGRNFINQTLLRVMLITLAINVWANVVLLINKALEYTAYTGGLGLFFMGVILIIIYFMLMEMSYLTPQYLCKTNLNNVESLRKINLLLALIEDETIDRSKELVLKGYIYLYEETCTVMDCPLKRLLRHEGNIKERIKNLLLHIEVLFIKAIDKYPMDTRIRISYAFFLLIKLKKKYHSLVQLENAQSFKSTIEDEFLQYKFRKYIEDYDDQLLLKSKDEQNDALLFKKEFQSFKSKIKKISLTYSEFWSVLLFSNKSEIEHLNKLGKEINNGVKAIQANFTVLQDIKQNEKEVLIFYIDYLLCVVNDKENGRKYKQILFNSNRIEKDISNYLNTNIDIYTINPSNVVTSDLNQYLVCSSQPESFGVISNISLGLCLTLGYSRNEIIGRKIDMIMPELIIKQHTRLLMAKAEEYRKDIVDIDYYEENNNNTIHQASKQLFLVNKSKYLVPITLRVGIIPNETYDFSFIAKVVMSEMNYYEIENSQNDCYIITNAEFVIQNFTSNAITLMGLNSYFINGNLCITDFIKEFNEEYLKVLSEYDVITNEQRMMFKMKIMKTKFKDKFRLITWRKNDFAMKIGQLLKAKGTSTTSLIAFGGSVKNKHEREMNVISNTMINNVNNIFTIQQMENPKFSMNVKEYKILNETICFVFKFMSARMQTPRNSSVVVPKEGNSKFVEGKECITPNNNINNNINNSSITPVTPTHGLSAALGLNKNYIPPNYAEFQLDVDNLSYKFNFIGNKDSNTNNNNEDEPSIETKRRNMREMVLNKLKQLNPKNSEEEEEEEEEEYSSSNNDNNDDDSYSGSQYLSSNNNNNNSASGINEYDEDDSHDNDDSVYKCTHPKESGNNLIVNDDNKNNRQSIISSYPSTIKGNKMHKTSNKEQNAYQGVDDSYYHVNLSKIKLSIYDFATRGFIQDTTCEYKSEVEKKTTDDKDVTHKMDKDSHDNNTTNINTNSINTTNKRSHKLSSSCIHNYFSEVYNDYNQRSTQNANCVVPSDTDHSSLIQKKIEESLQSKETPLTIINVRKASILTMIVLIALGVTYIALFNYFINVYKDNLNVIFNSNNIIHQLLLGQFYTRELTLLRNNNYTNFQGVLREDKVIATQQNLLGIYNLTHQYLQTLIITNTPFSSENKNNITQDNVVMYSITHDYNVTSFNVNIHTGIEHVNNALFFIATAEFDSLIPTSKHVFRYLRNSFTSVYAGMQQLCEVYSLQLVSTVDKYSIILSVVYASSIILLLVCYFILRVMLSNVITQKESYLKVFFDINKHIIQTFLENCEVFNKKIQDDVTGATEMSVASFSISDDVYYDTTNALTSSGGGVGVGVGGVIDKTETLNTRDINIKLRKTQSSSSSSYTHVQNGGMNTNSKNKTTHSRTLVMISIKVFIAFLCVMIFLSVKFALYFTYTKELKANIILYEDILSLHRLCFIFYNNLRENIFDVNMPIYNMNSAGYGAELIYNIYVWTTEKETKISKELADIADDIVELYNSLTQRNICYFMDKVFNDVNSGLTCETFMYGSAQFGLKTFVTTYLEEIRHMRNVLSLYLHHQHLYNYHYNLTLTGTNDYNKLWPTNTSEYAMYNRLNQINVYNWKRTREINYSLLSVINPAYAEICNFLKNTIDSHIIQHKRNLIWLSIGLIIFNMFWFFSFFIPFINGLSQIIYKTKNMLSIIPKQVLVNIPNIFNVLNIEINTIIRNQ